MNPADAAQHIAQLRALAMTPAQQAAIAPVLAVLQKYAPQPETPVKKQKVAPAKPAGDPYIRIRGMFKHVELPTMVNSFFQLNDDAGRIAETVDKILASTAAEARRDPQAQGLEWFSAPADPELDRFFKHLIAVYDQLGSTADKMGAIATEMEQSQQQMEQLLARKEVLKQEFLAEQRMIEAMTFQPYALHNGAVVSRITRGVDPMDIEARLLDMRIC